MTTRQTAVRLPEITQKQIEELIPRYGKNASQIMITAIDRMHREEYGKGTMKNTYEYVPLKDFHATATAAQVAKSYLLRQASGLDSPIDMAKAELSDRPEFLDAVCTEIRKQAWYRV